ncbi:MAG: hypothetical protein ACI4KF_11545 [Huintestinicola sp.]
MSYITNLRKYVGHKLLINVDDTIIVLNDKNEILLNLRSDTNIWGIFGGGMELAKVLNRLPQENCLRKQI